jgi:hypothetical protein
VCDIQENEEEEVHLVWRLIYEWNSVAGYLVFKMRLFTHKLPKVLFTEAPVYILARMNSELYFKFSLFA